MFSSGVIVSVGAVALELSVGAVMPCIDKENDSSRGATVLAVWGFLVSAGGFAAVVAIGMGVVRLAEMLVCV